MRFIRIEAEKYCRKLISLEKDVITQLRHGLCQFCTEHTVTEAVKKQKKHQVPHIREYKRADARQTAYTKINLQCLESHAIHIQIQISDTHTHTHT